jgi:hypothetical protein
MILIFMIVLDFAMAPEIMFTVKNIFFLLFLIFMIMNLKTELKKDWLLNPAILASILTFLLGYSITNFIHFVPDSYANQNLYKQLGTNPFQVLNYTMTVIIFSAIAMWWGYYTKLGDKLYNFLLIKPLGLVRYFRNELNPRMAFIYVLISISVVARLYAINLGVYGYAQSTKALSENIAFAFTLNATGQLINFSLILVAIKFFKEGFNFNYRVTLALIVLIEIYFGILSGMKSAVIFPVAILFICYYVVNKKIHKGFIVSTILLLIIAYMIIEPFRVLRSRDVNFQSSPGYIAGIMIDAYNLNQNRKLVYETDNLFSSIVSRNNYLLSAAKSIDFSHSTGLDNRAPDFLEKIYTVPLQAFIPRIFWRSKPIEDYAGWFSYVVWGGTFTASVDMSPIGFLYFAGGLVAVIIGFFVFGIIQKTVWNFYLRGGGQILIYFGFLTSVIIIGSSINGTLVNWLRNLPVFIILQSLLLKK